MVPIAMILTPSLPIFRCMTLGNWIIRTPYSGAWKQTGIPSAGITIGIRFHAVPGECVVRYSKAADGLQPDPHQDLHCDKSRARTSVISASRSSLLDEASRSGTGRVTRIRCGPEAGSFGAVGFRFEPLSHRFEDFMRADDVVC